METKEMNKRRINDEELGAVVGGEQQDGKIPYVEIVTKIDEGDVNTARVYFKLYFNNLTENERWIIRNLFQDRFGYPID